MKLFSHLFSKVLRAMRRVREYKAFARSERNVHAVHEHHPTANNAVIMGESHCLSNMLNSYLFSITVVLFSASCSTTKEEKHSAGDMDIKAEAPQSIPESAPQIAKGETIEASAAFNWQQFFKGTPTNKERPLLQKTIKQLSNASTTEDLMKRARNEFALGLLAASESTFRQVLRKDPKHLDALIELSATLQRQRRTSHAFETLAEAKSILSSQENPDQVTIFKYRYTLALTYLGNNERQKSHTILSDLIGKDKTFTPGYAALAFSYLKDGKDSVAKFIVEQALDRCGDHPALFNIQGLLAEKQGKVAAAREHYNRALALSDNYAPALVNRGNIYLAAHELRMAEVDYTAALTIDPSNADAMIGLGAAQRQSGRYKSAQETYERLLEVDPDNPQGRYNLAVLLRENMKDEGSALRYFSEVTQSDRANENLKTLAKAAMEEIRNL